MGTNFQAGQYDYCQHISIHVPLEGHDAHAHPRVAHFDYFNPRAPRGARHGNTEHRISAARISIHVPREGHDVNTLFTDEWYSRISIHVPREGHDFLLTHCIRGARIFQSTCPARGTTYVVEATGHARGVVFQSTCPARGTTRRQMYSLS